MKTQLKLKFCSRRIDKQEIRQSIRLQVIMKYETEISYPKKTTGCWELISEGFMFKDDVLIIQYVINHSLKDKNLFLKMSAKERNSSVFLHFGDSLSHFSSLLFVISEAPVSGDLDIRAAFRRTWVCAAETCLDQVHIPVEFTAFPDKTS